MDQATVAFLKKAFREFYFHSAQKVESPTRIEEREFGYVPFNGGMIRHLSFESQGELIAELMKQVPSSVYCSNATYSFPTLPMEEKGWQGAELIFDIDADSIPTSCKARHNRWYCQNCYREGRLPRPAGCPYCKKATTTEVHWTCESCLAATKEHTFRLMDFLTKDFGVLEKKVRVYFSGSRGYHINIQDERFEALDSQARAEIANYVRGTGLDLRTGLNTTPADLRTESHGWTRRVRLSLSSSELTPSTSRARIAQRVLNQTVHANIALIDQSVTTDVHRIFRMPGTLH